MTFGNNLQDQVPAIVDYISDGIHSLNQFRNFVRDMSHLERDYAQKLENIAKKYKTAAKKQVDSVGVEDSEWNDSTSTTSFAWFSILDQTEQLAKTRYHLVEDLNNCIIEPAKAAAQRKEDAKKKHVAFYQKLKAERDKTYADKDKAKQIYDDSCSEIENIQLKLNRTTGDKEKLQRQLDHAILECNNKKNSYLLSLAIANAERTKYHEADIPALSDNLQDLDSSRVLVMRDLYAKYTNLGIQILAKCQNHYDTALIEISKIDPEVDENLFIRDTLGSNNINNHNLPFNFVPYHNSSLDNIIDNGDSLILSDSSIIFLNNILVKDRKKLDTIGDELSRKSEELAKEDTCVQSITDKASENYDIAKDQYMDISRQLTILSTQKARVKSEIDTIIHCIGDEGLRAQTHDFKSSSFTIPTTCDYCKSTIWGLSNKGMTCKVCGFNCHAKCEMKVAPNCSGVRGKINEQPSSSNVNIASSIKSPTLTSAPLPSTSTQSSTSLTPSSIAAASYYQSNTITSTTSTTAIIVEALYDYQAQNEDELNITEGERLTVIGDPDDGWIKVQRGNESGMVPENYITMIETEQTQYNNTLNDTSTSYDEHDNNDLSQQTNYTDYSNDQYSSSSPIINNTSTVTDPVVEYVVALYDFEAVNADELNLKEGDRIAVTSRDDSGWWEGILNGQSGIFPSNYVQPV
ncbi:unnamed protein product [Cunninghamella blakesleeana]